MKFWRKNLSVLSLLAMVLFWSAGVMAAAHHHEEMELGADHCQTCLLGSQSHSLLPQSASPSLTHPLPAFSTQLLEKLSHRPTLSYWFDKQAQAPPTR